MAPRGGERRAGRGRRDLEQCAARARSGGVAAAAAFLERAVALSLDPRRRAGRTLTAVGR
ncbi:hypothetical protein [Lentzea guizhouensis]|uniref:hypothetical protein n=1 Tax=Lentzea guizhouensis TaxID=1586287 RepID=UPI001C54E650|nr:hypothetical protein [Lentzea guizhouensis]